MNAIVVYQTQTGFTEQYANWIAKALSCPAIPLNKVTVAALAPYDTVIYGGWLRAGSIVNFSKIHALTPNVAAVFAVGASPYTPTIIDETQEHNRIDTLPLFYMQGGICFEKLGFFYRTVLRLAVNHLQRKDRKANPDAPQNPTPLTGTFDASTTEQIQPLIDYLQSTSR